MWRIKFCKYKSKMFLIKCRIINGSNWSDICLPRHCERLSACLCQMLPRSYNGQWGFASQWCSSPEGQTPSHNTGCSWLNTKTTALVFPNPVWHRFQNFLHLIRAKTNVGSMSTCTVNQDYGSFRTMLLEQHGAFLVLTPTDYYWRLVEINTRAFTAQMCGER